MTTVLSSLASLSRKSRETESILLYTYRLQRVSLADDPGEDVPFDILSMVLHDNVDEVINGR